MLRIQPRPPAPPAAPAGALDDETERPIGIRRVRRPTRPIVTPPGDTPAGPARRRRRRPRGNRLVALAAVAVLAFFIIGSLLLFQPFGSAEGSTVRITIPEGSSAGDIGKQLADAEIIDSAFFFNLRATLSGKRDSLQSGPHTLRKHMTYGTAIAALSDADTAQQRPTVDVTIPEGRSRREIAPIAEKAGLSGSYLDASQRFAGALSPFRYDAPRGTRSLEGFLFPATYELDIGAPARDLVERQLAAFRDNFASVNLSRARRGNLTAYDVLIIASMVEREAQLAKERPLIAAVIYNRLKDGTPLGIDATTRYALNKPSGALKQSELDDTSSPYNTRKRAGLPPTPIGNPGLSSIRAAANPANVQVPLLRRQARNLRRARLRRDDPGARPQRRPLRRRPRGGGRQVADDVLSAAAGPGAPRYGVLGWPVGHSRSPAMMQAAGLERYQHLPVAPAALADTVRALYGAGFRGANVTIPHKEAALALATAGERTRPRDRRRQHADVLRRGRDRGREHRRARPDRGARRPPAALRARARSRRQRPRRRLGAGPCRRRRRDLEPHAGARGGPRSAHSASAGRKRTSWSIARASDSTERPARSRICRWTPMG